MTGCFLVSDGTDMGLYGRSANRKISYIHVLKA